MNTDLNHRNIKIIEIEQELDVVRIEADQQRKAEISVKRNSIVFVYSPEQSFGLEWPEHKLTHVLDPMKILVYAYPLKNTSLKLSLPENSTIYLIKTSIAKLHEFFGSSFGKDPDEVQSFAGSFRTKNIYSEKSVTPAVSVVFHQMFNHNIQGALSKFYFKGKIMEFLSHYMQSPKVDEKLAMQCSFVNNHLEMEKIREARNLIVQNLVSPPGLKELARMVGTNEFKLKIGFKSTFGNTVYGYLTDYRLEKSRYLLEKRNMSVKQISSEIGYANSSHFIAAYKKKFGVTPKKYLLAVN